MTTATLKFVVTGDSYDELKQAADSAILRFLNHDEDDFEDDDYYVDPLAGINYEMVVTETKDIASDYVYTAEVIARIKDVRTH